MRTTHPVLKHPCSPPPTARAGRPSRPVLRPQAKAEERPAERPVERRSRPRDGQPGGRVQVEAQLRLRLALPAGAGADTPATQIQDLLAGDLSSGGVFVQCPEPPTVGERAQIEVCRPGGGVAFVAQGRVVWRRPSMDRLGRPPGFGLAFERLDIRDGTAIQGIVDLIQRQRTLGELNEHQPQPELQLYDLGEVTRGIRETLSIELPPEIARFVTGYDHVSQRDPFLWRWAYQGVSITTLSCVDQRLAAEVHTVKLLGVMFSVLLEDAAERPGGPTPGAEPPLFSSLCQLWMCGQPLPVPAADQPCLDFARRIYQAFSTRSQKLGRYAEFAALIAFDLQQLVQTARHQLLLRRSPHFTSESESRALSTIGLPLTLSASIDACASPTFDARETGLLREVLTCAQRMAYTGFLLSSWERRCQMGDLSSGIAAYGLASGALSVADVDPGTAPLRGPQIVARLREARVDSHFMTEWLRDRYQVRELARRLRSVDVTQLLSAHQRLMWLQLGNRGLV